MLEQSPHKRSLPDGSPALEIKKPGPYEWEDGDGLDITAELAALNMNLRHVIEEDPKAL